MGGIRGRAKALAVLAALVVLAAAPAFGSGGPPLRPLFVDRHGGTPAELSHLYSGRLGLVMANAPEPILYLDWRLLHGLRVGQEAGEALSAPCCDAPGSGAHEGPYGWLEARAIVPGVPASVDYLPTDLPGPDYTRIPNCFDDAFDSATAILRDRAARYGARAPAVRAWLLTQDAVFAACGDPQAMLPAPMAAPPAWLAADRAYQEAAFALYQWRNDEAALRFAAIARDPSSPWRGRGLYLQARAIQREALAHPGAETFAKARAALAALGAAPAGTYGQSEARKMRHALAFRDQPERLLAELDGELRQREPTADIAVSFKDYLALSEKAANRPEAVDWIETMQGGLPGHVLDRDQPRVLGLKRAHALERWRTTQDPAWLIATLALTGPGDAGAVGLAEDAARVKPDSPAWLSAQYHLVRLTIGTADAAAMRTRLDAILARPDLAQSERNLFGAARTQVASDLADFARFALRAPYCAGVDDDCADGDLTILDGALAKSPDTGRWVGFGDDARAIVDRLPLRERIALSHMPGLPAPIRLDLALTDFARAVQLQDDASIDGLARDLGGLLPQMRREWRTVAAAPPGPAKRFAEYFAMAKLPGLRADLADYSRPQGTVRQFQGTWVDWEILPRGTDGPGAFPAPSNYLFGDWYDGDTGEADLTCLSECGVAFPFHLPPFVAALQDRAEAEESVFAIYADSENAAAPLPAGALSAWDETLLYARAHPRDPRSPEVLYWLIHVGRWGGSHDHLGRRAFALLHTRYPRSVWAARSPYYYD